MSALEGQIVVVIGGSAGIGLETARLARAEGAEVVITARNPERLESAAREVGATRTAAFDATTSARLERFFADLPTPIDHVLVTGPGPDYAPLSEFDFGGGAPRSGAAPPAPAAGRAKRRRQGSRRRDPALHGRHRWPRHGAGLRALLGAHRRGSPRSRGTSRSSSRRSA